MHIEACQWIIHVGESLTRNNSPVQDDLVCLPPKTASALGNLGPVVLCTRVTTAMLLMDPISLRSAYVEVSWHKSVLIVKLVQTVTTPGIPAMLSFAASLSFNITI